MVAATKTALPTVNDPSSSMQLSNSSKQFSQALTDLRTAVTKARDTCGPLELDSALDMLYGLKDELDAFSRAVDASELKPLPGETPEGTAQQFSATSKAVGSNMAQLLTAVNQGDEKYTGMAARSTAVALQDFTDAVRGVAATSAQPEQQHKIINSAKDVVDQAIVMVEEARSAATNPQDVANQQRLTQVARDVSQALNKCAGCLPGQKDVDDAIQSINHSSQVRSTSASIHFLIQQLFFPPLSNKFKVKVCINVLTHCIELNPCSMIRFWMEINTPAATNRITSCRRCWAMRRPI